MDAKQKRWILKRFLKDISVDPDEVHITNNELATYASLDKLLDFIADHNDGLFNFTKLEFDESQWQQFTNILNRSASFTPGSPPTLISIDEQSALHALKYWKNAGEISQLPQDNYYTRPVFEPQDEDMVLTRLLGTCRRILYELLQSLPDAKSFNPANNEEVNLQINAITKSIRSLKEGSSQTDNLNKQLLVLQDLIQINQLKHLKVSQEKAAVVDWCKIIANPGGVTEKLSLMQLSHVKERLVKLCALAPFTLEEYLSNRKHFLLFPEAIIKLPKYGDIREVQREAIALNLSRIIGLTTTSSVMVSYDNHPALFIPFDDIDLLSEFTIGKHFASNLGLFGESYQHYSTISPLGDGIQPDTYIEDFGHALGLLYLCSDTDAIGGNCQNKALVNARHLYIFDQVIMDCEKFVLDSRLCLQPDQFIWKHTRHGQGRNRTLIEDSLMASKFESLQQLKKLADKMTQYLDYVAWQHHQRIDVITELLQGSLEHGQSALLLKELNDIKILAFDAGLIKSKIAARISRIDAVLPKTSGSVSPLEVQQALILEKLINRPLLFSDDARPYKNPWTNRHVIKLILIKAMDEEQLELLFNDKIPEGTLEYISRKVGGDSVTQPSQKSISISRTQLLQLVETLLYPEHNLEWSKDTNYLDPADLDQIKLAYEDGNTGKVLHVISEYQAIVDEESLSRKKKVQCIKQTESALKELIQTAAYKGFGMHMLKKFYFDAQQKLHKMIDPTNVPTNLCAAFLGALRLDRVSEFNSVLIEGVVHCKFNDAQFTCYLDSCIHRSESAKNYKEALQESAALYRESLQIKAYLKQFESEPVNKTKSSPLSNYSIFDIRNFEDLNSELTIERTDLTINQNHTPSIQGTNFKEETENIEAGLKL